MHYMNVRESRSGNQRMDSPETRATLIHTQTHTKKHKKQNRTKQKRRKINED